MKCPACRYQYIHKSEYVDEIIKYKKGKKKGQIKTVERKEIVFEVGHSPFVELRFRKDVDDLVYGDEKAILIACPECGTIKIKNIGEIL